MQSMSFLFHLMLSAVSPIAITIALVLLVRFYRLAPTFPLVLIGLGLQLISGLCHVGFSLVSTFGSMPDMASETIQIFFQLTGVVGMAGQVCMLTGLVLVMSNLDSRMGFLTDIVESSSHDRRDDA